VAPTTSIGSGYKLLGIGVREFAPTPTHETIISTASWPPPISAIPDPIADVRDFAVSTPCSGGAFDPYTELLVGLGLVSTDGGGWQGIEINYSVG
jgi:hypothetical protein